VKLHAGDVATKIPNGSYTKGIPCSAPGHLAYTTKGQQVIAVALWLGSPSQGSLSKFAKKVPQSDCEMVIERVNTSPAEVIVVILAFADQVRKSHFVVKWLLHQAHLSTVHAVVGIWTKKRL
jgi:hypothetical protein